FEALSAPPSDTSFSSPEMLFSYAEETDRIVELERLCRREAVMRSGRWTPRVASRLEAENPKLFLNCSAPAFTDPELCETLIALTGAVGYRPDDIVLEVTERVAITEWQAFQTALARVRRAGLKVAIDDMGSGYSSLHAVAEIEPDYLKFDLSLILNIHRSRIKRNLLESLVLLADKISARTIAEGLECEDEFETVRRMGIEYGQGYLFARPAPPSALDEVHFPRQVA
ncbi:MAG: EAL domain-containing protein, partial [Acidobacteriota bacterium]